MKIKEGDNVLIITGKYKGKTGKVMRVLKKINRVVVEKINIRTKHIKKTSTRAGERIQYEAPFDASKVMLIDPKTKKPTRVGYKVEGGKKYRVTKKSGERIEETIQKKKESKKA